MKWAEKVLDDEMWVGAPVEEDEMRSLSIRGNARRHAKVVLYCMTSLVTSVSPFIGGFSGC